ncbi:MAG: ParB/RepB/Spo0J family partition protein [Chitinophagales bacterium]
MSVPQYTELIIKHIRPYPKAAAFPDDDSLRDLAERIRHHGFPGFLVVRPNEDGTFGLLAGVRLWRAAQIAGVSLVPCLLRNMPEAEALAERLREIIKERRSDNAFEEGLLYQVGMEQLGWTTKSIHEQFGRSTGAISEKLGLVTVYGHDPRLIAARAQRRLSDRAVISLRRILDLPLPEAEQVARLRAIAGQMLAEEWPAAIAADMVDACLKALDEGKPFPPAPAPEQRRQKSKSHRAALKDCVAELERTADTLEVDLRSLRGRIARLKAMLEE